jgi:peptidoglycan/LPS O-acetylase OafA/YrhL
VSTAGPSGRRFDASRWGWVAVVAAGISVLGFALQTILDHVSAPHDLKFAEFWGLFAGNAVIGFLAGVVAIVFGWRTRRRDATIAFGLIGVGWLLLVQAILVLWD